MPSLLPSGVAVETFTGVDGTAPNATNWVVARNEGTGGSVTVQGGRCRIRTGAAGGNRTSLRVNGITALADSEIVLDWDVTASVYPAVILRSDVQISTAAGYVFTLRSQDMVISRKVSGSSVDLVTATHGFTFGGQVRTRIALFGQRIRVRTWARSGPEPTSVWQVDYTDTGGITAGAHVGVTVQSFGSATASQDFFIDNVSLSDTITPSQATVFASGSLTPAGSTSRTPVKRLTGSVVPVGGLVRTRAVFRLLAGSLTPTGSVRKLLPKRFVASLTPSGLARRSPQKRLAGSVVPAGLARRALLKRFAGSVTPTNSATSIAFIGRIFGRPGLALVSLVDRARVTIRRRKG